VPNNANDPNDKSENDGLLSVFKYHHSNEEHRPTSLICITIYNESLEELEKTLDSVRENLTIFQNNGIQTFEILVVIIFDGIAKMNNENNQLKSIVEFFKAMEIEYKIVDQKQIEELKQ